MVLEECVEETLGLFGGWRGESWIVGIGRDEIDFCVERLCDIRQLDGVVGGSVDAVDKDIFEGDHASCEFAVLSCGIEDFSDFRPLSWWDELSADGVVDGVERYCQVPGALELRQLADAIGDARRGDGDVSCAESQAVWGTDCIECFDQVVEVVERFAHSHDDDIGDEFSCLT